jgi:membrane-associated phospholipid phosphatase
LALPTTCGVPLFVGVVMSILALTVCLGRVALGVHYPLDVLAGAGLGILGAGIFQMMLANFQFAIL